MRKKNKSHKTLYLALIIIALMVFSGFAIVTSNLSSKSQFDYNDFQFQNANNRWYTTINGQQIDFHFHPSELENINSTSLDFLDSPQIYVTFNPQTQSQYLDLSRLKFNNFLVQFLNSYSVNGISQLSGDYDLPLITCQNATSSTPVMIYQKGNQTQIIKESNCLYLTARTDTDFLRLTERVMYSLAGVIND